MSKSDILPPSEIEAIERKLADHMMAHDFRSVAESLLRHLRALAAPADGEALGRVVRDEWIAWAREQPNPKPSWLVPWEGLSEPDREVDRRIGLRCHVIGHAAGALSREGEIVASRSELARWRGAFEGATPEEAAGAIRDKGEEYRAEIARLTAELAEARASVATQRDCGCDVVCAMPPGCMRHWEERNRELVAELAEVRKEATAVRDDVVHSMTRETDARVVSARADGAREEREAIAKFCDAADKSTHPADLADAIRARGDR